MKVLNRKGFTLVELIATIVLLSLIMGLGSYAITNLIKSAKDKNYTLLIKEIKSAVEEYHIECKYVNNNCVTQMTLGDLVKNGYLKANDPENDLGLINPKDNKNISTCNIKYEYNNSKISVSAVTTTGSCPSTADYQNN